MTEKARSSSDPAVRMYARMIMRKLSRGGGNGDEIRMGILNIMRDHGIKEGSRGVRRFAIVHVGLGFWVLHCYEPIVAGGSSCGMLLWPVCLFWGAACHPWYCNVGLTITRSQQSTGLPAYA
eukprot:GHRQ01039472.1.p3 GENE.GHRQ01039472.1~~GHRQ01039472.1.p3  ORF type:complete len:122 (-),score=16.40 GHRQ01039472.1:51-416(-)